ncbi:MAG: hypothetical protein ACLQDV_14325 [Candidatus Binataceae bacterium]
MFLLAGLSRFKPRSNGTHAAREIAFGYQTAAEHDVNECEQLTLWRRNIAIHGLCKLILGSAPVECRERPANCKAVARCDETCFPRWIRIGNAVTRRKYIPGFLRISYRLEQCDPAEVNVTSYAHG